MSNHSIEAPGSLCPNFLRVGEWLLLQPIQRLANSATGLRLTAPLNPCTGSELTFSIQPTNGLTRRYDYIMPCEMLFSNIVGSQDFRTDLLNPLPLHSRVQDFCSQRCG